MAGGKELLLVLSCFVVSVIAQGDVVVMTDGTSDQLRSGEWMIKFYAPWCPACQQFTAPWIGLARKLKDSHSDVKIAKVDVTTEAILSGRFMIQQLPTLYHAKDGQFRRYNGERTADAVEEYIKAKLYEKTEPIPSHMNPMGPIATTLGYALVAGTEVQRFYGVLTQQHGLPGWLVIACGAVSVITAGVLVGLVFVCCISMFTGSNRPQEAIVYPKPETSDIGSTGENDEVDKKGKSSPKPSPKPSPSAAAVKSSPSSSSPRERKGKGKKMKASTD